jgi:hypothetical protein
VQSSPALVILSAVTIKFKKSRQKTDIQNIMTFFVLGNIYLTETQF